MTLVMLLYPWSLRSLMHQILQNEIKVDYKANRTNIMCKGIQQALDDGFDVAMFIDDTPPFFTNIICTRHQLSVSTTNDESFGFWTSIYYQYQINRREYIQITTCPITDTIFFIY